MDPHQHIPDADLPVAVLAEVVDHHEEDEDILQLEQDFDNHHLHHHHHFGDEFDDEIHINQAQEAPVVVARFNAQRVGPSNNLNRYLYDLIREQNGTTCVSLLPSSTTGCQRIVQRCREHPEEALYAASQTGRTPLHEACLRGSCRHVLEALLHANSFGTLEQDHHGNLPLHLLFCDFYNHDDLSELVELLLRANPTYLAGVQNADGSTPLHIACKAPETRVNVRSLQVLVEANPSIVQVTNIWNQTPLRLHCERRNASLEIAQFLVDAHPDALCILDGRDGWGPLHYAAHNTHLDLIELLVQNHPGCASILTNDHQTALHLLTPKLQISHLSTLRILSQAYPEACLIQSHPQKLTPLHLICRRGDDMELELLQELLETDSSAAAVQDQEEYLPLHHACERGAPVPVIAALLEAYPAAAQATTRKNDTALSLACTCNVSTETVQLLLQANPQALELRNDYGFGPLHCVCRAYLPRMGIVQALLEASPSLVLMKTNGGETPVHLACSNAGAYVGVLQLLTDTHAKLTGTTEDASPANSMLQLQEETTRMTNKIGNTPLHDACFRNSPLEHMETLAKAHPEWIFVRNNAGYTPLQILCKSGRIDETIVKSFSRIGGPEIFQVVDKVGNTPLHSALREDIQPSTLQCLIRSSPDALNGKTIYGDTPLHLACFRKVSPEVVKEVALASFRGQPSPVLEPNNAGETAIGIAMNEFQGLCRRGGGFCCVISEYRSEQTRTFEVLAILVKILFYGKDYRDDGSQSLVQACVSLHRQGVRLDPAFIRRAIHINPQECQIMDDDGNYPLHIEASIPIEKMPLLDTPGGCCHGICHKRSGILRMLLEVYPRATAVQNKADEFPFGLMIQNGRTWGHTVALALRAFPPALQWYQGLDDRLLPIILEKVARECGAETIFSLIVSRPSLVVPRTEGD